MSLRETPIWDVKHLDSIMDQTKLNKTISLIKGNHISESHKMHKLGLCQTISFNLMLQTVKVSIGAEYIT